MLCIVKRHIAFTLVTDDDDMKSTTLEIVRCEEPNPAQTTRAKIDGMSCGVWEGDCGRPMDGESEDLVSEQFRDGTGMMTQVRSYINQNYQMTINYTGQK